LLQWLPTAMAACVQKFEHSSDMFGPTAAIRNDARTKDSAERMPCVHVPHLTFVMCARRSPCALQHAGRCGAGPVRRWAGAALGRCGAGPARRSFRLV
jgi:hypothetical protein